MQEDVQQVLEVGQVEQALKELEILVEQVEVVP